MTRPFATILGLMCLITGTLSAANTLVVTMTDGTTHAFSLNGQPPVMTFSEDNLIIDGDLSATYPWASVVGFCFSDATALDEWSTGTLLMTYTDNRTVHISGLPSDMSVTLYSIAGQRLTAGTSHDGMLAIDLPAAAGTYLINIGSRSFKIIKK